VLSSASAKKTWTRQTQIKIAYAVSPSFEGGNEEPMLLQPLTSGLKSLFCANATANNSNVTKLNQETVGKRATGRGKRDTRTKGTQTKQARPTQTQKY
jgi:hypothetical protein